MIHSVQFIAVLDTNVIYPVIIRDMLLWFAHYDLYTPKWSKHIFDEWFEVMLRKGVSEDEDFPAEILAMYGLKTKTADDFLTDIIDLNQDVAVEAFREMVLYKKKPPLDEYEVLDRLRRNSLKQTADYLHSLI